MSQAKVKECRYADGNAGKTGRCGNAAWRRLAIAFGLCVGLTAGLLPAQVAEQNVWPRTGNGLWYWIVPKMDLVPEQVDAAFEKAIAEEMAFLDPGFGVTVFFAKHIRVTKGKSKDRKKYPDRPEKADDIRIETEWQNGYLNQYRGFSYRFIALDSIRSLDLHYLPNPRERFSKVPEGRNWNVNILAGSLYHLFFATEDTARNFINAVASLLKQRGMGVTFSRFGLMWENVTPAQAAELGRPVGESVLVTMVALAGPGDRAGILPLDVIIEVNGVKVKNFSHFSLLLDGMAPGTKASLVLLRRLKTSGQYPEEYAWNPLTVEMEAR
jgi:hypothetical protein